MENLGLKGEISYFPELLKIINPNVPQMVGMLLITYSGQNFLAVVKFWGQNLKIMHFETRFQLITQF